MKRGLEQDSETSSPETRKARTPKADLSKATLAFDEIIACWRRERPDLELDNMLLTICLTRLGKMLENRYEALAHDKYGISGSDLRVLLALRRSGRPYARRPTDLFRALIVTSGAITKQVDRLTTKGLVARAADPLHAGGFLVHLTAKGLKLVNSATEDLADNSLVARAMSDLSDADRKAGVRFVEHLIREIERDHLV